MHRGGNSLAAISGLPGASEHVTLLHDKTSQGCWPGRKSKGTGDGEFHLEEGILEHRQSLRSSRAGPGPMSPQRHAQGQPQSSTPTLWLIMPLPAG